MITVPNYEIIAKLGEGPQSIVYKAFHKKNPARLLMLKILKAASLSKHHKAHFSQKIEHLTVSHDALLITTNSFEVKGGVCFITQDYFEGVTLDEWAKTQNQISF